MDRAVTFTGSYQRRIIDNELDELFLQLPAVLLDGPKAVGKTSTAEQRCVTIRRLDVEAERQVVAADPALAARLVKRSATLLLSGDSPRPVQPRDGGFLGGLFEHLATLPVRVFAQTSDATVHHLRTEKGRREVDLIVESDDGILGIEVKMAASIDDTDVRHLAWLRDKLGDECIDTVVLHSGPEAYRRHDGIAVVPLALLGP